jgi:hypothetical protein
MPPTTLCLCKHFQDFLSYTLEPRHHVPIRKPHHFESTRFQISRAYSVVLEPFLLVMLRPVYFDYQFFLRTIKIQNVPSRRSLSSKSHRCLSQELVPKFHLGRSYLPAHLSGTALKFVVVLSLRITHRTILHEPITKRSDFHPTPKPLASAGEANEPRHPVFSRCKEPKCLCEAHLQGVLALAASEVRRYKFCNQRCWGVGCEEPPDKKPCTFY